SAATAALSGLQRSAPEGTMESRSSCRVLCSRAPPPLPAAAVAAVAAVTARRAPPLWRAVCLEPVCRSRQTAWAEGLGARLLQGPEQALSHVHRRPLPPLPPQQAAQGEEGEENSPADLRASHRKQRAPSAQC